MASMAMLNNQRVYILTFYGGDLYNTSNWYHSGQTGVTHPNGIDHLAGEWT